MIYTLLSQFGKLRSMHIRGEARSFGNLFVGNPKKKRILKILNS